MCFFTQFILALKYPEEKKQDDSVHISIPANWRCNLAKKQARKICWSHLIQIDEEEMPPPTSVKLSLALPAF